jgi:predicted secreted Zn-dependent protease
MASPACDCHTTPPVAAVPGWFFGHWSFRVRRFFIVLIGLVAGVLFAGAAPAEVISDVRYKTYTVRGQTAQEIWRNIGRRGPHQRHRGLYAQALSEIRYGWSVTYERKSGSCRVDAAKINVRIVITLPKWAGEKRGAPRLRKAWQRYLAKVRRHEDRHRTIALETAKVVDREFKKAPQYRTCNALKFYLEKTTDRVLARERRRQDRFDKTDPPIFLR